MVESILLCIYMLTAAESVYQMEKDSCDISAPSAAVMLYQARAPQNPCPGAPAWHVHTLQCQRLFVRKLVCDEQDALHSDLIVPYHAEQLR